MRKVNALIFKADEIHISRIFTGSDQDALKAVKNAMLVILVRCSCGCWNNPKLGREKAYQDHFRKHCGNDSNVILVNYDDPLLSSAEDHVRQGRDFLFLPAETTNDG